MIDNKLSHESKQANFQHYFSLRAKLKIKHTPIIKPGYPPPASCSKPLGFCIIRGIEAVDQNHTLTIEEVADGMGLATVIRIDDQIKFIPDRQFALEDSTIRIDIDYQLPNQFASETGLNRINLIAGTYQVNLNEGEFGSVLIRFN